MPKSENHVHLLEISKREMGTEEWFEDLWFDKAPGEFYVEAHYSPGQYARTGPHTTRRTLKEFLASEPSQRDKVIDFIMKKLLAP